MEDALAGVVEQVGRPDAEARIAKRLAEYDYRSLRRLERTRILVRMGPALGLMGTLIPLSPALAGLADGDVATLTDNLRVAFSVTVAGLLIGAFAFAHLAGPRPPLRPGLLRRRVRRRLASPRPAGNGIPAAPQPLGGGAVKVTARARSRDDRAGDPLDGLVNLFDLGIVLSVAFLLAALSSLDLTEAITGDAKAAAKPPAPPTPSSPTRTRRSNRSSSSPDEKVVGRGKPIGTVYELSRRPHRDRPRAARSAVAGSVPIRPRFTQTHEVLLRDLPRRQRLDRGGDLFRVLARPRPANCRSRSSISRMHS